MALPGSPSQTKSYTPGMTLVVIASNGGSHDAWFDNLPCKIIMHSRIEENF